MQSGSNFKDKRDIDEILASAKLNLEYKKFIEAAKKYRQIASITQKIGNYFDENKKYAKNNALNDLSGKDWLKHTKSWLIVDGRPSDIPKEIKNHPGSFPPELIRHFIEFFTKEGGWVLDPFVGIGSTLVACESLNRNCLGLELNQEYCKFANGRIEKNVKNDLYQKVIQEDSRKVNQIWKGENIEKFDFLITSPPYFNILQKSRGGVESTHKKRIKNGLDETYGIDPRDIGNITIYEKYLEQIFSIFENCKQTMRENSYLCVIAQNFRPKDGIMVPLAWDLGQKLSKLFTLRQEYIWLQDQKQMGIWGYPSTYVSNVHHHYCLIFQNS